MAQIEGKRPCTERLQRLADIIRFGAVPLEEEAFDRPRVFEHAPQDVNERNQVDPARPPMSERLESRCITVWLEPANEGRRRLPHRAQNRVD
jgi:hypothetical protein